MPNEAALEGSRTAVPTNTVGSMSPDLGVTAQVAEEDAGADGAANRPASRARTRHPVILPVPPMPRPNPHEGEDPPMPGPR